MIFNELYEELQERIELQTEDIEKLKSIIEDKRQDIANCFKVLDALEEGDFIEDNYFGRRK